MMRGGGGRCLFTASQWQELEHQALIFKYMASGAPVPHDLIIPIRRSLYIDQSPSSPMLFFHHQPCLGWGNLPLGFGKKIEDPEPWRCRRTDGKKWRCSKEAFPDSKYCERHMHRGKNRSRKPVENPNIHQSMVKHYSAYDLPSNGHRQTLKDSTWRSTQLGLSFSGGCSHLQQETGERDSGRQCFVMGKDMRAEKMNEGIFPTTQLSISMSQYDQSSWVESSCSPAGN
ncbi:growth-regulating factor 1-like [Wolffia australiana]